MDRLIDLLNEYEKIREKVKEDEEQQYTREKSITGEGVWRCDTFDTWEGDNIMSDVAPSYIISKSYSFIEWLVKNNKIGDNKNSDRYTMMKLMREEINEGTDVFEGTERYEFVIMILSIQDYPVEFLASILK